MAKKKEDSLAIMREVANMDAQLQDRRQADAQRNREEAEYRHQEDVNARNAELARNESQRQAAKAAAANVQQPVQATQQDSSIPMSQMYLDMYKNNQYKYDVNADPYYQMLRENALRNGQTASKNVQAQAAALTGGYGNSYGAMAAGQAYNQYLQGVNDAIPELEQNAYARYQDEQNRNLTLSQMYLDMENQKYNRELNEAGIAAQYGDYSKYNAMGIDTSNFEKQQAEDREYELFSRDLNTAQLKAQYGDFGGLNALGFDTSTYESDLNDERDFTKKSRAYTELTWKWDADDHDAQQKANDLNYAITVANSTGDYSALEKLGFDASSAKNKEALANALQLAETGDYSALKALGIDTSYLEAKQAQDLQAGMWQIALQAANVGDYSYLEKMGVDTSQAKFDQLWSNAMKLAEVYDYSGLEALGVDVSLLKQATLASINGTGKTSGSTSTRTKTKDKDGGDDEDEVEEETDYDLPEVPTGFKLKTNLTDADRQLLRDTYKKLGLTPRGNVTGGEFKGWVVCSGADGTYYVCIGEDGKVYVQ